MIFSTICCEFVMHAISCLNVFPGLHLLLKFSCYLSFFCLGGINIEVLLYPQEFCSQRESIQKQRI